jgi:hypothetical protein
MKLHDYSPRGWQWFAPWCKQCRSEPVELGLEYLLEKLGQV